ncbi:hypothetical protein V8F33_013958 [Rhypophila sp. PSN 637]
MASNPEPGMTYYDIAFRKPYHLHSAAPNPWKGRYALNFKGVPYKTHWTPMLDIPSTRKSLGIPACRTFPDGTEFYTLPALIDNNRGEDGKVSKLGDSFDIAVYLDRTYPGSGAGDLIPADITAEELGYTCPINISFNGPPLSDRPEWREQERYKRWVTFNDQIDNAFTLHVQLMGSGMKWPEETENDIKAEFATRAGVDDFDKLQVHDKEARAKLLASLKDTLKDLAAMFEKNGDGPYLRGEKACFADIVVGGWLRMMSVTLPDDEWEEVKGWYGGVFGRLHDALQREFGEVK